MLGNKRRESNHFAIVVAIIFDIVGEVNCGKQNYLAPLVWSLFLARPEASRREKRRNEEFIDRRDWIIRIIRARLSVVKKNGYLRARHAKNG